MSNLRQLTEELFKEEEVLRQGGGAQGKERQKRLGRLTARERVALLFDKDEDILELGLWAGYQMYEKWGNLPAAGVITAIGRIEQRDCMVIANDATVKAGAMFPQSVKKVLRAQRIAYDLRIPIIYLVDSSGVFLPLQEEIFPDEDDFGRIFRNNSVLSACGIPQYAAIMGNCIAGGGYLPVLCDKLLMTEGSGLYLAGPALVKAAIGQIVDTEELGGALMHAQVSGTVDFLEPDDAACIKRLRSLIDLLPLPHHEKRKSKEPETSIDAIYEIIGNDCKKVYDARDLIKCIIDKGSLDEYKQLYGQSLVTAYARIGGEPVGIVANQRLMTKTGKGEIEIGGVVYSDSANKAARFVMECNQSKLPLIFLQDVVGFMVGKEAEQSGIIRAGAKLVNVVSNSIVPKITIVVGNSFGAGNYALCGKAYDPNFIVAWPNAKYAVMGGDQAADTLLSVEESAAKRKGEVWDEEKAEERKKQLIEAYLKHMDIRFGAARGWIDAIIAPHATRETLVHMLHLLKKAPLRTNTFHTGVLQV